MSNYPDGVTGNESQIAGYKDEDLTETGIIVYINDEEQRILTLKYTGKPYIFDDIAHALDGAKAMLAMEFEGQDGYEPVTARFELQQQTPEGHDRPYMLDTTLTFNPKNYTFTQGRV